MRKLFRNKGTISRKRHNAQLRAVWNRSVVQQIRPGTVEKIFPWMHCQDQGHPQKGRDPGPLMSAARKRWEGRPKLHAFVGHRCLSYRHGHDYAQVSSLRHHLLAKICDEFDVLSALSLP